MARIDPADVQVLFIEMQPPIVASAKTVSPDRLRKAAAAIASLSEVFGLPVLASGVPMGPAAPGLIDELGRFQPAARTTLTPFADAAQRARLENAGRRTLAVGGVSTEIGVLNTVLDARREGYEVHVLVDCCGGLDERTDAAALRRMELAGAIPSNVSSFFTGLFDDMTTPEGGAVMGALAQLWGWNG